MKKTIAWHSLSSTDTITQNSQDTILSFTQLFLQPYYANELNSHRALEILGRAGDHLQLTSLQSTSAAEPLPRAKHHLLLEIPFVNY